MSAVTEETYQALARYELIGNIKIDLKVVAEMAGITAKAAWSRMDKARKSLKALSQGGQAASPTKGTAGKKTGTAKTPPKKRTARGKKKEDLEEEEAETEIEEAAEEEGGDDDEDYGGGGKRFKRELSDGGMTTFGGKSDAEDEDEE